MPQIQEHNISNLKGQGQGHGQIDISVCDRDWVMKSCTYAVFLWIMNQQLNQLGTNRHS